MRVIEAQCRAGRQMFDLGVGEAAYKDSVCDGDEPLVDVTVGVSPRGRVYALASDGLSQAKRFIKRTPWAWRLAQRLRDFRAEAVSSAAHRGGGSTDRSVGGRPNEHYQPRPARNRSGRHGQAQVTPPAAGSRCVRPGDCRSRPQAGHQTKRDRA
jgi:hypothetical protein